MLAVGSNLSSTFAFFGHLSLVIMVRTSTCSAWEILSLQTLPPNWPSLHIASLHPPCSPCSPISQFHYMLITLLPLSYRYTLAHIAIRFPFVCLKLLDASGPSMLTSHQSMCQVLVPISQYLCPFTALLIT
jgi:hypothetical protein